MIKTLENGIYRIQTNTGEFAETMAVQVRDGKGRPVRIANSGKWGYAREAFADMTDDQIAKLAEYGLHANQSTADHTK